ncbi:MAG: hypothetical protein HZB21_01265, partial [Deltaproteobacteria bacterium]|nr:hypothetical protein [Deltaproteobacteria bacterium]
GAWGLMAVGGTEIGAKVVAETSPKAWADINRNRRRDRGETLGSYGIIAVSRHGKGKVVVVADDAPFANKFIKEADNGILAENILRWFASKSP